MNTTMTRRVASLEEKFRKYMPDEPSVEDCWPWTGLTNVKGYGRLSVGRRSSHAFLYAHRVSYQLFVGPIPDGFMVRHRCDNPICCNPHHLRLGTPAQNSRDMTQRSRQQTGTQRHNARLTDDDVREIRALYASGLIQKAIAAKFGTRRENIGWIVRNKTWRHVT